MARYRATHRRQPATWRQHVSDVIVWILFTLIWVLILVMALVKSL